MAHQVTGKGQVTLPKKVLEYPGTGPGSGVEFVQRRQEMILVDSCVIIDVLEALRYITGAAVARLSAISPS